MVWGIHKYPIMIPEFPQFKKLELKDREAVEGFTSKFPPYSDFNFVSMWSWDIKGEMEISQLNNNLVVRFTDYLTGKPFFSFLGDFKVKDTITKLVNFSKKNYKKNLLKLVPLDLTKEISDEEFHITPDKDSYDYIYSVEHLANMNKWPQHASGKNVRSFTKSCINYTVKHTPVKESDKTIYMNMFEKWVENKEINDCSDLNERKALERIFETKFENLNIVSLHINDFLVGFTIYEILSQDYAISHFAKADTKYHKSVSDLLNWEEAKILHSKGVKYFNWEQDLGIPGLRKSKEKYKPVFHLKKVTLTHKEYIKSLLYQEDGIEYNKIYG